jgi:DNA modification methylase
MITEELLFTRVNPAAYNPRVRLKPSDQEYKDILGSLEEFGQVQGLVWNKRTGNLVAGHQRMWILQDQGRDRAHFTVVDLPLEKEKRLNVILNKVTGKWDNTKLAELLRDMQSQALDITSLGFNPVELNSILKAQPKATQRDPDDAPPPNADDNAYTQRGDIYTLVNADGRQHRLMCGSSEDAAEVAELMEGKKAKILFTDPPYGVSYKTQNANIHAAIANDELRGQILLDFLTNVFKAAYGHLQDRSAFYVFYASRNHIEFETALRSAGFTVRQQLLWVKQMALGRSDYHWAHEPMLYGGKTDSAVDWYGDRTQKTLMEMTAEDLAKLKKEDALAMLRSLKESADVWEERRDPPSAYYHPTQKPTSLPRRAIRNSTMPGDLVLELFGGSGSTIVGAELEDRVCYAMELSPGHCDSIVRRWLETFECAEVWKGETQVTTQDVLAR